MIENVKYRHIVVFGFWFFFFFLFACFNVKNKGKWIVFNNVSKLHKRLPSWRCDWSLPFHRYLPLELFLLTWIVFCLMMPTQTSTLSALDVFVGSTLTQLLSTERNFAPKGTFSQMIPYYYSVNTLSFTKYFFSSRFYHKC